MDLSKLRREMGDDPDSHAFKCWATFDPIPCVLRGIGSACDEQRRLQAEIDALRRKYDELGGTD